MQSLVVKISNPDTVHAIAEAAKRQGTTPEPAALELLETAVLAQKRLRKSLNRSREASMKVECQKQDSTTS
jgi:sensor c-di-GMP phosphodiesterase-like protein